MFTWWGLYRSVPYEAVAEELRAYVKTGDAGFLVRRNSEQAGEPDLPGQPCAQADGAPDSKPDSHSQKR